jgi:hypothetical protein
MAACEAIVSEDIKTRDKRVMNHMDPETRVVHARLEAWGAWAKESEAHAWPSVTLLGRMIEQGPGAGQSSKPPIAMPDEIAAVDAAVCRLNAIDKKAVQLYYIRWAPLEIHARNMGMRARQYQNVLRRARWRLAGYLQLL